ncbi:MAG: hypothetical protein KY475_07350 [Planctomycetes bacterium]|nr:hypothetical protein [Planctomycetota bacterium]
MAESCTATISSRSSSTYPDSPKNRRWMKEFKNRWKERLEQLELWMVSYRLDIE